MTTMSSLFILCTLTCLFLTSVHARRKPSNKDFLDDNCGRTIKITTSRIISLSSDLFYPTGWNCQVKIRVPDDHVIWLSFRTFDVGRPSIIYCTDVLRIYDGSGTNDNELSPTTGLCGRTLPHSITSSSNTLTLKFRSSVASTSTGFTLLATTQRKVPEFSPCWRTEFRCHDDACVDRSLACDGQFNCQNGEDESSLAAGCEGLVAKWTDFSLAARIGIIAGVVSLVFLSACFVSVCCCTPKMRHKRLRD